MCIPLTLDKEARTCSASLYSPRTMLYHFHKNSVGVIVYICVFLCLIQIRKEPISMSDPNDMIRMMAFMEMNRMMDSGIWYAERKIDARRFKEMVKRGIRRLGILFVRFGYWLQHVGYTRYVE